MLKRQNTRYSTIFLSLALSLAVFLIYAPVAAYGFVNYDDDLYVSANQHVQQGLTWAGIKWAFSSVSLYYWHPLTWLSHMADVQFFGLNPGAFHLVNVAIHAANAILVLLLFKTLTGKLWPSAIVAGLFAFHPLRVESVAWIAERKDVLSAFFGLLTVWAYVRYTRRKDRASYLWMLLPFGCALMSKPTVVTLPLALLALDYWPLERLRFGAGSSRRIVLEKLPLIGMSVAVSLITVVGQAKMGASVPTPLEARFATAISAYVRYLGMLVWPHDLSVIYPYTQQYSAASIMACLTVFALITGAVIYFGKTYRFLCFGWFWYLLMLLPMSGLIRQAGPQALADRFTYLPCIGLFAAIVWLLAEKMIGWRNRKTIPVVTVGLILVAFSALSADRVSVWKDSVTLFSNAVAVAPESAVSQHDLAYGLAQEGRYAEAIPHYRLALEMDPKLFRADYNLGRALYETGKVEDAVTYFQRTLAQSLQPEYESDVRNALGIALMREGAVARAQQQFARALQLKPNSPELYANLGSCLAMQGNLIEAIVEYRGAIRLKSDYADAHRNLGIALGQSGQRDEAQAELQTALQLNPNDRQAEHFLEMLRATR